MTDDRLRNASEELRQASAAAEDAGIQRRLYDLSDRIAALAAADEAPSVDDLTQHLHALGDLRESTVGDVDDSVDAAIDALRARREEREN
jgi:hypothetical protein